MSQDDYELNYKDFLKKIGKGIDRVVEDEISDPLLKCQVDHIKKEIKKNERDESSDAPSRPDH